MYSPMYSKLYDAMRSAVSSDGYPVMYWTPLDLFGLGSQGFWYDPSDLSTLFRDVAGTVPVTAVGQPVALMLDKSGRGNHLSISVPASCPILRQNATTGAYYLETDGADDYMVSAPINLTSTDKITVFCGVRKLSDATTFPVILETGVTAADVGSFHLYANSSTTARGYAFAATGLTQVWRRMTTDYAAPDSAVLTAVGDLAAMGDLAVPQRRNGVPQALSMGGGTSTGGGTFGKLPLYLFRRGGTTLPWAGHFYGLIGLGRLPTATETLRAERWLARKVGITL